MQNIEVYKAYSPNASHYSAFFSKISGNDVYLKLENLQNNRAFKIRGASNFVLQLDSGIAIRGVIVRLHPVIMVKLWLILLQKWDTHV